VSKLAFNLPLNPTSFGQVSFGILRELFERKENIFLFPIGNVDISTQNQNPEFFNWIQESIQNSVKEHRRSNPIFKLWHLNGSLESYSDNQVLFTFYEVDSPTKTELNIIKNNKKVLFSSRYALSVFENYSVDNIHYLPLAFDSEHFKIEKSKEKDGIYFGLFGKLEPQRKRHIKALQAWIKKYGNKHGYYLNCAIFNPFLDPKVQNNILGQALEGKNYWNINFLSYMQQNSVYNETLNNTDIVIAMSGGEGWGLPEFQSVALGKHCVGLNAHAYKEWMTEENSVLVNPINKIPCYDNMFFRQGADYNQGNIFDWNEDDLVEAFEKVENKYKENPINKKGLDLQKKFTFTKMVDCIIDYLK
jgi:hypothetical protein